MTVTSVRKDPQVPSLTLDAEFDASEERVWELWSDPRQLERWWGPPTYPATFTAHDLTPGGRAEYRLTGPDGQTSHGYWEVQRAQPPNSLVVRDGFANPDGSPNADMPAHELRVTIRAIDATRTRMTITSVFSSTEAMEQLVALGMEEGLTQAVGQVDSILAEA